MNRKDIIRMANEAGFHEDFAENWLGEVLVWEAEPKNLERFAALVAARERELCAKLVDRLVELRTPASTYSSAIRKRRL